jgi:nitrate/TMAO reductase-like tetraheme cytochrome c subunit
MTQESESPSIPPETIDSIEESLQAQKKRRRWPWWLLGLLGIGFLFLFFIASVELLHFTESKAFCTSCHVMYPEERAYEVSPHARTDCGTCHIGPGALAAVQAKMANARYLWVYPLNLYERPIPSPIESLRPVEVVCEQCHWPQKFYEDRVVVIPEHAQDMENSLTQTVLALKTGGGQESVGLGRGIHWHIDNPVYYIATDEKRQEIPWVQAEYNGVVTEYMDVESSYTPQELEGMEKRKMDCVDCHNRASHNFRRPDDVIDNAMATGALPADLPELKKQGVAVLERKYTTAEEAAAAIAAVEDFYKTNYPAVYSTRTADVKAAVAGLQEIFDTTQFPFMNLTWDSHKNNIGHKDFPGCFRCHDGKHLSADNQAIRLECNICHSIPQVADPGEPLPSVNVASQPQPPSHNSTTWLAEHRYQFDASCAACHTVSNPGGTDNSSFCSNSACHATEWKYAGLNAPEIRELSAPETAPAGGGPQPIPHPIGANTDCTLCHGPEGVKPFPASHADFTSDMCTGCHPATIEEAAPAPAAAEPTAAAPQGASSAPGIPHVVDENSPCAACHGPDGVMPHPENHAAFPETACRNCHQPMVAAEPTAAPEPTATVEPTATRRPTATVEPTAGAERTATPSRATPTVAATATAATATAATATRAASPTAAATPTQAPSASGDDEPPAIAHDLAGRENCLMCHDPEGNIKPAPANHAGRTVQTCQACHKPQS